ncbi:hypothetical protein HKX48_001926 [Thoreauomyces humboldtii]|nr:hypothetical protein HKX48_001926 [Thoreauomyces humboldtii]
MAATIPSPAIVDPKSQRDSSEGPVSSTISASSPSPSPSPAVPSSNNKTVTPSTTTTFTNDSSNLLSPDSARDLDTPDAPNVANDDPASLLTTVFDDPNRFNAKHPLQNSWTLWFDNPQKRTGPQNWEKSLKNLITFDTVEDFWGVYNNVVNASQLGHGSNYHLFKEGTRPMWEDPENKDGGKWVYTVPKAKNAGLDQNWLFTMLACVGESFPASDEICGAVISLRKQANRIALWTKDALNEDAAKACGAHWKEVLQLPETDNIGYQSHNEALQKNSR